VAFCYTPFRKVTPSSADGLPLVLPFISCVPSGFVTPKDLMLLVRELEEGDNIEGMRLARATISRIHFFKSSRLECGQLLSFSVQ
jgi:hypothetical protein